MSAAGSWRSRLDTSRAELLAAADGLTADQLNRRPPGEPTPQDELWPPRDILWHVAEQERRWQRWVRATLAGERLDGFARAPRPQEVHMLSSLLDALAEARAGTFALLDELATLGEQAMTEQHPGPREAAMSFDDVFALQTQHSIDHAQQIREALDAPGPR